MINTIKKLLGIGPKVDFDTLIANGAVIVDVRTKAEFDGGHVKGSINIPLNNLTNQMGKIKKDKTVITCCASGIRSASAKSILKSKGYDEVYNGGSWQDLNQYTK